MLCGTNVGIAQCGKHFNTILKHYITTPSITGDALSRESVTGIVRSVFSALFGIAPAASIALYGVSPWLPLAIQLALFLATALCFALMKARRWPDPMPPDPWPDRDQRGAPEASRHSPPAPATVTAATEEIVVSVITRESTK